MKHHALLFRIPSQIQNLDLGCIPFIGSLEISFANTFSQNEQIHVSASCHAALHMTSSCLFHQPRQDRRFVAEWLLRAPLNVTPDASDDPTCQHHCVLDESHSSTFVTSALHISATRFLNAMIAGSVSLFSAIKSLNISTLSIVRGSSTPSVNATLLHAVLMSVFSHRDASYGFF